MPVSTEPEVHRTRRGHTVRLGRSAAIYRYSETDGGVRYHSPWMIGNRARLHAQLDVILDRLDDTALTDELEARSVRIVRTWVHDSEPGRVHAIAEYGADGDQRHLVFDQASAFGQVLLGAFGIS
jgi:hypothetical protein